MEHLRPTVKRDISLFSVQAWQKGYLFYLKKNLGWSYPIIFFYDGRLVNFYHRMKDFEYFKKVITQKLINNNHLFKKLNSDFISHVNHLKEYKSKILLTNITKIYDLIAKIMSFYVFVVSDAFVEARPDAWKSRNLSEGILYKFDHLIEQSVKKKLKENRYEANLVHYLNISEIKKLINNKEININTIKKRQNSYLVIDNKILFKNFKKYCEENNLLNPEFHEVSENKNVDIIYGKSAYKGNISGKISIIINKKYFHKFSDGNILVSVMTNANFLPLFKKAKAIITDEGGITCHAAIVAREMKKPCIVGTKIATKVLKDGDLVEVDADKGIIRKIS